MPPDLSPLPLLASLYRDARLNEGYGWWVLLPDWMLPQAEQIRTNWHGLAGHPLGELRGFEFLNGPRFTYDQATDAWSEETPEPEDTPIERGI